MTVTISGSGIRVQRVVFVYQEENMNVNGVACREVRSPSTGHAHDRRVLFLLTASVHMSRRGTALREPVVDVFVPTSRVSSICIDSNRIPGASPGPDPQHLHHCTPDPIRIVHCSSISFPYFLIAHPPAA